VGVELHDVLDDMDSTDLVLRHAPTEGQISDRCVLQWMHAGVFGNVRMQNVYRWFWLVNICWNEIGGGDETDLRFRMSKTHRQKDVARFELTETFIQWFQMSVAAVSCQSCLHVRFQVLDLLFEVQQFDTIWSFSVCSHLAHNCSELSLRILLWNVECILRAKTIQLRASPWKDPRNNKRSHRHGHG
jgi:hypothetical protein